ncbi:MAG: hypothetical protein RI967_1988, partial [Planctomycetota bacterium]
MKPATLIVILGVVGASVGGAYLALAKRAASDDAAQAGAFVESLGARADAIDRIELARGDDRVALEKSSEGWTLATSDGYPARFEEIKGLVAGIAALERDQRMTALPSRHGELGLAWPDGEGRAARVTLRAGDTVVADLVLGAERANPRSQFVRNAAEDQCWRVLGSVVVDLETRRLVEAELLSLPEGEVESVSLAGLVIAGTTDASGKRVFPVPTAPAPTPADTPDAFEWTDARRAAAARTLPGWLARLELDEVRRATGGDADPLLSPVFEMVRGTLRVKGVRDGDDLWISFEATPREGAPGADEINAKRKYPGDPFVPDWTEFAAKHAGWEYRLPRWKTTAFDEIARASDSTDADPDAAATPLEIPSAR